MPVEPLRQEPKAPLNNATSRADRATLRDYACASVQARVTAFLPPAGAGGVQSAGLKRSGLYLPDLLTFFWIFFCP